MLHALNQLGEDVLHFIHVLQSMTGRRAEGGGGRSTSQKNVCRHGTEMCSVAWSRAVWCGAE